jgi:zinc transporter ZupT
MNLSAFKYLSAAVLLVVALIGGLLPLKIKNLAPVAMHIANSFAGGILIAVGCVHMLPDASGDLEDAGKAFSKALGGDEDSAFPIANALFLIGFILILNFETVLHHKVPGHVHNDGARREAELVLNQNLNGHACSGQNTGTSTSTTQALPLETVVSNVGGWATLVGLSVHSVVEGVAAGASSDEAQTGYIMLAIACHKGFASFANGSANIALLQGGRRCLWIALVVWFSLSGSLGIVIGLAASDNIGGAASACVTALAAGTLLSVGITDMLMPAFTDKGYLGLKVAMATFSTLVMTLVAVWA